MKPSIGRIVHLATSGNVATGKGCLAAVVTSVHHLGDTEEEAVSLHIFGLNGDSWNKSVCFQDEAGKASSTWHWPERVD